MYEESDRARLDYILSMIRDIEEIVRRYDSTNAALNDTVGRHALLMCLMQIGEKLYQLRNESITSRLPVYGAYSVRNIIAHDYGGVNNGIIDNIVRDNIPELKKSIEGILDEIS
jgi:uncharacterized protein with HEPN domain